MPSIRELNGETGGGNGGNSLDDPENGRYYWERPEAALYMGLNSLLVLASFILAAII